MSFGTSCLLAVVAALCLASVASALSLERVRLVHNTATSGGTPSFLFRGDVPDWLPDDSHTGPLPNNTEAPAFLNNTLVGFFALRLAERGIAMPPPPYYIVDVNLLGAGSWQDDTAIDAEKKFFDANPQLGRFVHFPTFGTAEDPSQFTPAERSALARNFSRWDRDHLELRIPELQSFLTDQTNVPAAANAVFVYVHCIGGEDRTGEVMGSYAMRFLNQTAPEAFRIDWLVGQRWPHENNRHSMRWYCYALEEVRQPNGHPPLDCGAMVPTLPPNASPLPPTYPCERISRLEECGFATKCMWVRGQCVSACWRWPDAAGCGHDALCAWNVTRRRCVAASS